MPSRSIFKDPGKIVGKLRDSGLGDVADAVLTVSPVGGYWQILKKIGAALGLGPDAGEDAIAEALETATPEQKVQLLELAVREKEATLADAADDRAAATSRHATDMMSDSPLSKTWRPIVGYLVIGSFLIDHFSWRVLNARGIHADPGQLIADITVTVIGFYFGSRGLQHVGSYFASKWTGKIGK
jgi:hypothetical protein